MKGTNRLPERGSNCEENWVGQLYQRCKDTPKEEQGHTWLWLSLHRRRPLTLGWGGSRRSRGTAKAEGLKRQIERKFLKAP